MKGQSSLDTMLAFALGLLVVTSFFMVVSAMMLDSIVSSQASTAADLLGKEADYTRSLGPGTVRHVDVFLPWTTSLVNVSGQRVHIQAALSSGTSDFYSLTDANVSGGIGNGTGIVRVEMRTLDSGVVNMST